MKIRQIGIDTGKTTFHMVALNEANEIVIRRQFTRAQLITFFRSHGRLLLRLYVSGATRPHPAFPNFGLNLTFS